MFRQIALLNPLTVVSLIVLTSCNGSDISNNPITYDADGDGLIEIHSLADLDEIRHDLSGGSLYGENRGCPASGCVGFELTQDLDFDTNNDGVLDEHDTYWNEGKGWLPLAKGWLEGGPAFSGIFDGSGFKIVNFYSNRPNEDISSLFGVVQSGSIKNLGLTGELGFVAGKLAVGAFTGRIFFGSIVSVYSDLKVIGESGVGGISGQAYNSLINESINRGSVDAESNVGGIVGFSAGSSIAATFNSGSVTAKKQNAGGILGTGDELSKVVASFSSGSVTATGLPELIGYELNGGQVGGLVGGVADILGSYSTGVVSGLTQVGGLLGAESKVVDPTNYWVIDASTQVTSNGGTGVTLAELKCPTVPEDESCGDLKIFAGWNQYVDENNSPYWDFGTKEELPGLRIQGQVFR